jgi:hypothetical protein
MFTVADSIPYPQAPVHFGGCSSLHAIRHILNWSVYANDMCGLMGVYPDVGSLVCLPDCLKAMVRYR